MGSQGSSGSQRLLVRLIGAMSRERDRLNQTNKLVNLNLPNPVNLNPVNLANLPNPVNLANLANLPNPVNLANPVNHVNLDMII